MHNIVIRRNVFQNPFHDVILFYISILLILYLSLNMVVAFLK